MLREAALSCIAILWGNHLFSNTWYPETVFKIPSLAFWAYSTSTTSLLSLETWLKATVIRNVFQCVYNGSYATWQNVVTRSFVYNKFETEKMPELLSWLNERTKLLIVPTYDIGYIKIIQCSSWSVWRFAVQIPDVPLGT